MDKASTSASGPGHRVTASPATAPAKTARRRALAFYRSHDITAKQLMTDNAWIYVRSRAVQQLLSRHEIRHLTTQP
jgi:hypothetical protein